MNSISEAIASSGFKTIDFVILVCYLILLVSLGLFLSRNKNGKEKSANDYFLAGNTLTWWAVGASLIAANISAEQFIGMSGTGFRDGIAIAAYEVMAAITLVVIGKFLLPVRSCILYPLAFPLCIRKPHLCGLAWCSCHRADSWFARTGSKHLRL